MSINDKKYWTKRVEELAERIPPVLDEIFFASDAYREFTEDAARNMISGICTYLRANGYQISEEEEEARANNLRVVMQLNPNGTAYTDGNNIHISANSDMLAPLSSRELRHYGIQGFRVHEVGHVLFTDFQVLGRWMGAIGHGNWWPHAPKRAATPQGADLTQMMKKPEFAQGFLRIATDIENAIEDGFIEREITELYGGLATTELATTNDALLSKCETFGESLANREKPFKAILHQLLLYAKFDFTMTDGMPKKYDKMMNECIAVIDETKYERDPKKRLMGINELCCILYPVLKDYVEEAKQEMQQGNGSSDGTQGNSSSQDRSSGSQQSSGSGGENQMSDDELKSAMNQAANDADDAARRAGASQEGRGQNSKSITSNGGSEEANARNAGSQRSEGRKTTDENGQSTEKNDMQDGKSSSGKEADGDSETDDGESSQGGSRNESISGQQGNEDSSQKQSNAENDSEGNKSSSGNETNGNSKSDGSESSQGGRQNESASGQQGNEDSSQKQKNAENASQGTSNATGGKENSTNAQSNHTAKPSMRGSGTGTPDLTAAKMELDDIEKMRKRNEARAKVNDEISKELSNEAKNISETVGKNIVVSRAKQVDYSNVIVYKQLSRDLLTITKNLERRLKTIIRDEENDEAIAGLPMGSRVEARLAYHKDGKIFSRKNFPRDNPRLAVGYLCDESGSMSDEAIRASQRTGIIIQDLCERMELPCYVDGYTTAARHGDVQIISYVENNIDSDDRYRITGMRDRAGTPTAEAMRYMGEKMKSDHTERKLLIVSTDGRSYGGRESVQKAIKELYRYGILVVGAGIGESRYSVQNEFGDNFIDISNLESMPHILCNIVKKNLV